MLRLAFALLLAPALAAQATEEQQIAKQLFSKRLVDVIRSVHAALPKFDACLAELDEIEGFIAELEPGFRSKAALAVDVRRAEIHLLAGRDDVSARILEQARDAAREADAWDGRYRAIANVLAWQAAPVWFDSVWDEEREAMRAAEGAARTAHDTAEDDRKRTQKLRELAPLVVMRLNYELQERATQRVAERELRALAEQLPALDDWRHKAYAVLVWHFVLQRDYDRANTYLDELPQDLGRYPRARVALRRHDFERAMQEGEVLALADARYEQLVGDVLWEQDEFVKARIRYRAALDAKLDPLDKIVVLRGLVDCSLRLWHEKQRARDLEVAEQHLDEAERLCAEAPGLRHVAAEAFQLTVARGHLAEARGDVVAALGLYEKAIAMAESIRGEIGFDVFGGTFLATDDLDAVEGVLRTHQAASEDAFRALAAIEANSARTLLNWSAAPPTIRDREAARRLARAVHELAVHTSADGLAEKLDDLEAERIQLEARGGDVARSLNADAIAAHTREWGECVFLWYWLGREQSGPSPQCWVAWAQDGESGVVPLGSRDESLARFGAAVRAVTDPRSDPAVALERAADWFLPDPVRARIASSARVVICPDVVLGRLPFEALPVDGTPLGVRVGVERTPSLSVRRALASRGATGSGAAVLYAVEGVESIEASLELDPLEFSPREGAMVVVAYGDADEMRGADASRDALGRTLRSSAYDVVHVSAHAVFDPRVLTDSFFLLADGVASIASLTEHPLNGALVVMSACSSATGSRRLGEGEIGLLGWPCAAGARGAVAALRPVNQQATMDLMAQFHAICAEGVDEVEAMREARAILAAAPNYAHPHYWSGFGVFSAPAVPTPRFPWAILGAIAVCFGVVWLARRRD